jgi:hypothetical protein
MQSDEAQLQDWSLRLALLTGAIANYCDHVEHNETANHGAIGAGARELRLIAQEIAETFNADLRELFAERLAIIEARNVLAHDGSYDGAHAVRCAESWRELQLIQADHDRVYHPDVVGMSKWEQLHHHTLHLIKLAAATAAVARREAPTEDWLSRRVPDMLLFGIKLSTVGGERLPAERLSDPAMRGLALAIGASPA